MYKKVEKYHVRYYIKQDQSLFHQSIGLHRKNVYCNAFQYKLLVGRMRGGRREK